MYLQLPTHEPVSQGDILDSCPLFGLTESDQGTSVRQEPTRWESRVIVLTQACDLAQAKTRRVLVAVVHPAALLVEQAVLTERLVRDQIRRGQVFGLYFLPARDGLLPESIVDLRNVHTLPRHVIEELVHGGERVCRVVTPYREHLAQHFGVTYSRIGLPEPYDTER